MKNTHNSQRPTNAIVTLLSASVQLEGSDVSKGTAPNEPFLVELSAGRPSYIGELAQTNRRTRRQKGLWGPFHRCVSTVLAMMFLSGVAACQKDNAQQSVAAGTESANHTNALAGEATDNPKLATKSSETNPPRGETNTAADVASPTLNKVTITLWHAYREEEQAALEQLVSAYNARGGPVTVEAAPVPYDAFVDKISVTVPRGKGPDLFIFAHNLIGEWASTGVIEPITPWAPADLLKQFIPSTVKALVYEKSLYGLPLAYKSIVLFYNRQLVPNPPKTISEMLQIAKSATQADQGKFGLVVEAAKLYFHAPWLFGYGGALFDESESPRVDGAESVAALQFARRLVRDEGIVPPGLTGFMIASMFSEGKAAFALSGPWFRGEIGKDIDFGVTTIPVLDNGTPPKPFLGSEAVLLSKMSANKPEAMDFARFLASDTSALVRAKVGKQPVANVSVYENPEIQADPMMAVFKAQAQNAVIMPSSPAMQAMWSTYDTALQKAIFGDMDPALALAEAQTKIAADVSRLKR